MIYWTLCIVWGIICAAMQYRKPAHNSLTWVMGCFLLNVVIAPLSFLYWVYTLFGKY